MDKPDQSRSALRRLRSLAGDGIRRVAGAGVADRVWEAQSKLGYAVTERPSRQRLRALEEAHRGERCVIVGNGPSLNETNLELVRDEFTFGLNRIGLAAARLDFEPSCLVSMNRHVIEQSIDELLDLPVPKFLSAANKRFVPAGTDDVTFLRPSSAPRFSYDVVRGGVWEGATVTFVAMQLAHWFGFTRVVLIGVDHSFAAKGTPHSLVTASGPDPDHFDPAYFSSGYRWQLPDLEQSETAYRAARQAFEASGREIVDATVGGKLQVFEKRALEDVL